MGDQDIQSRIGILEAGTLALTSAGVPATATGSTIDTKGMRGIMFAAKWASALTALDEIKLQVQESDDGSTWTTVDDDRMLPTRRQSGGQLAIVTAPTSPYLQTWGAFGTKRYVRAAATSVVMSADESATVYGAFIDALSPVERWDADYTSVDGNP